MIAEAASNPFPTWYIVVSVLGLLVAAGGMTALAWVIRSIWKGWQTLHQMEPLIPGLKTVVDAFVGSEGKDGQRAAVPLLTQLDANSKQGAQNSEDILGLQRGIDEIRRQVSPNGGNTDSFADQFIAWRRKVGPVIDNLVENQEALRQQIEDQKSPEAILPQKVDITLHPAEESEAS